MKDEAYKQKVKDFILENGSEEAFSFAMDLIVNTTEFDTVLMDKAHGFLVLCKPESVEYLRSLGITSSMKTIEYDDSEESEYPGFNDKDKKVH